MPLYQLKCDRCGEKREHQMSFEEYDRWFGPVRLRGMRRLCHAVPCGGGFEIVPARFTFRLNLP